VRKNVRDRSECHHDESEHRVGGVEAVRPVDDESHPPIESLVASTVRGEANRGEVPRLALANGLDRDDEQLKPAALYPRTEPVEHHGDLFLVEVAAKDRPKCLFERLGTPEITPSTFQLAKHDGLVVAEMTRLCRVPDYADIGISPGPSTGPSGCASPSAVRRGVAQAGHSWVDPVPEVPRPDGAPRSRTNDGPCRWPRWPS
jgi:hypothetical protein